MKRTALLTLFMVALGAGAWAQPGGGFGLAPPDAMDSMSGASAGGGLNTGNFLDRASNAVNAATQGFGNSLLPQRPNDPFANDPFAPPPAAGGFQPPPFTPPAFTPPGQQQGGAPAFGAAVAGATGRLNAIGGERIRSRVSGELLQDARAIKIFANAVGNYFDDGRSGGDLVAGDQVYTNIVERNDVLSPSEFVAKSKLINGLRELEDFTPQDFTGVRIATQEPTSTLPKLTDLEAERDERLKLWADQFLRDYRVNPDQVTSPFLPVFMPLPPRAPDIALPAQFSPRWRPAAQAGMADGQGGGTVFGRNIDGPVTGEPIGAASSRYF